MKLPNLSTDAVLDLLLRHVEKIVVLVVAVLAMGLAWGGIETLRTQTVTSDRRPDALAAHARRTLEHIDREKQPPDSVVPKPQSLTKLMEPWRASQVAPPPEMALLDSPVSDELGRRTKPVVFPIENLHAEAGVAVLKAKAPVVAGAAAEPPKPEPAKPTARKGRGETQRAEGQAPAAPPQQAAAGPVADAAAPLPPGRIAAYVVVTGLIPLAKQATDYAQRFASTSLRDPKRDKPLWSDYVVERSTVVPGGRETWERVDLKAAAEQVREWAGLHADTMPPDFLLAADRYSGVPIGYCWALPQLANEGWGAEALHPFFRDELERRRGAAANAPPQTLDYRLFRFVDFSVESGKAYRYRVSLKLWNPNWNVPDQHLAEATLAKDQKLFSEPSQATAAVIVPSPASVLVRTLPKADMRRFKPGTVEVLVLGPDDRSGNYALRSVITDIGGFANVDRKLNKPGDVRTRGEEIFTGRLVVDAVGRQENRADMKLPKNALPPEPLELILMREDGGFDLVTAAESEGVVTRYAPTLPDAAAKPVDAAPAVTPQPLFPGSRPR
jgi:hypothetical protein